MTHPNLPAFVSEPSLSVTLVSGFQIQSSSQEPTLHPLSRARAGSYPLCASLDVYPSECQLLRDDFCGDCMVGEQKNWDLLYGVESSNDVILVLIMSG